MEEEFTGEFFVSNEEDLSDFTEHLSIASHATDGTADHTTQLCNFHILTFLGYDHGFLADDSSSHTHQGSTLELLHEEPNGSPHLETGSGFYEEPNVNVQDEIIGMSHCRHFTLTS